MAGRSHFVFALCCGIGVFAAYSAQSAPRPPETQAGAASKTSRASREILPPRKSGKPSNEELPTEAAPTLRVAPKIAPPPKNTQAFPTFMSAARMDGEVDREFVAQGDVELRKRGSVINADSMTYWPLEDEVEADGHVRFQQLDDLVTGPKMRLRLPDQVGYFEQPVYRFKRQLLPGGKPDPERKATDPTTGQPENTALAIQLEEEIDLSRTTESRGTAERLYFEGENQYRLVNNTFTTCPAGNDSWYLKAGELNLDYDYHVAHGEDASLYFQDVPFLYSPWFSFSLSNQRKSGFLTPSLGTNSENGIELDLPYYWNIAPNMDATLTTRPMSRRGVQMNNEFRYLNTAFGGRYNGKMQVEYLPNDRLRDGISRHAFSLAHTQTYGRFTGEINYSKVSDDHYYTDLSNEIGDTSQTQVLQRGRLSYGGDWWGASINVQRYQTLRPDEKNPVLEQYQMLPRITFNARRPDVRGLDMHLLGQYTHFTIQERQQFGRIFPDGQRSVLYPQISAPYTTPGWYVTPKLGLNYRAYSLTGQKPGDPGSISVTQPIFSLDTGMTFERAGHWFGRDHTQTLEPRLYYLNIPYREQGKIPIFDTGLTDFNFAQIFSENQFSGWDRINNANQLTAALTSRLLNAQNGDEIMRGMIGQRFYFTQNKVALGATALSENDKWRRSDILAGFRGQVLPKVFFDTAWQYDVANKANKRFSAEIHYRPEPGKVLNVAYRYGRDTNAPINQLDVSGQWPLLGRWYGVGRMNYSFKDDETVLSMGGEGGRIVESIGGLEYNGGCWVLRGVVRRQVLTSEQTATSFFVQLELSGLGRIGTSPLNLLKRNIQGYGLIGGDGVSVFDD